MSTNDSERYDADDVEAALQALHSVLTDDLEELEKRMRVAGESVNEYREARTALHSGLASIAEVLGWIQWKTEEEPEGEVAVAIQPIPTLRGCSIH